MLAVEARSSGIDPLSGMAPATVDGWLGLGPRSAWLCGPRPGQIGLGVHG